MFYTENDILSFGKYRNWKIKDIPNRYFLNLFVNKKSFIDQDLIKYIEDNYEKISGKKLEVIVEPKYCTKITYPNEKKLNLF